jgi:hypothetical protein
MRSDPARSSGGPPAGGPSRRGLRRGPRGERTEPGDPSPAECARALVTRRRDGGRPALGARQNCLLNTVRSVHAAGGRRSHSGRRSARATAPLAVDERHRLLSVEQVPTQHGASRPQAQLSSTSTSRARKAARPGQLLRRHVRLAGRPLGPATSSDWCSVTERHVASCSPTHGPASTHALDRDLPSRTDRVVEAQGARGDGHREAQNRAPSGDRRVTPPSSGPARLPQPLRGGQHPLAYSRSAHAPLGSRPERRVSWCTIPEQFMEVATGARAPGSFPSTTRPVPRTLADADKLVVHAHPDSLTARRADIEPVFGRTEWRSREHLSPSHGVGAVSRHW